MKTCTKCKIEKPFEAFYKQHIEKDGYRSACKECNKARQIELKKNPLMQLEKQIRSSIILENKLLARDGKRLCGRCKEIFLINEMNGGVICYPCERKRDKEIRNTEYGKRKKQLKNKEYRQKNKDKIKEYQKGYNKEYQQKNKDKIKEHQRKYRLKKKKEKNNE